MQKWEYKGYNLPDTDDAFDYCLQAGEEGWELAGTIPKLTRGLTVLIFKRPKQ